MKMLHLSDLHLGLKICEMPMIDEQRYIFGQIFDCIKNDPVDAVIIAGDIYDKSIPPVDAVLLFDEVIDTLSEMGLPVFIISGNHDSADRLSFGSGILKKNNVFIGTDIRDSTKPVTLRDKFGNVNFYLLPFLRPVDVNNAYEQSFTNYTSAIEYMVGLMNIDPTERNIIISHQFVSGASVCDSETIVGGTECVDKKVYEPFDYAALGHIHSPQQIGSETIRYCGTPLKYSLSEAKHKKSMTVVTLNEKGNITIETPVLTPLHDMRKIKGTFSELTSAEPSDDYIYAELTNNSDVQFAAAGLRAVYKNLVSVSYTAHSSSSAEELLSAQNTEEERSPEEIFTDLYKMQNGGRELSPVQQNIIREIIEKIWR